MLYYRGVNDAFRNGIVAEPATTSVVLFTGILFPVVFGAIGGGIHHLLADDSSAADRR